MTETERPQDETDLSEERSDQLREETIVEGIIRKAEAAAGVPAVHSPATSVGEKIIYRCSPGKYDGDFEHLTITMRFISKDVQNAHTRARNASTHICAPGDRDFSSSGDLDEFVVREAEGGSGYIGRTGHYFVLVKFSVRRRLPAATGIGVGQL